MLARLHVRSNKSIKPAKLRGLHTTSCRQYASQHKPPTDISNVKIPRKKRHIPISSQVKRAKKTIPPHEALVYTQMEDVGFTDMKPLHTEISNVVSALKALPAVLNMRQLIQAFDLIRQLDSKRFQKRNLERPWVVSALYIEQWFIYW